MKAWTPPADEPARFSWWQPLLAFSRRVRADRVPWPVHIDEFVLDRRFDRPPRPAIWIYLHDASGGAMMVDDGGRAYRFIEYRGGRGGRFKEIDVRRAVWQAGLPDVVEPVWYDEPPRRSSWTPVDAVDWSDETFPEASAFTPSPRRNRRLRLVSSTGETPT